jgi:hypothetical protein
MAARQIERVNNVISASSLSNLPVVRRTVDLGPTDESPPRLERLKKSELEVDRRPCRLYDNFMTEDFGCRSGMRKARSKRDKAD